MHRLIGSSNRRTVGFVIILGMAGLILLVSGQSPGAHNVVALPGVDSDIRGKGEARTSHSDNQDGGSSHDDEERVGSGIRQPVGLEGITGVETLALFLFKAHESVSIKTAQQLIHRESEIERERGVLLWVNGTYQEGGGNTGGLVADTNGTMRRSNVS